MIRHLLIDADILVFKAAAAVERTFEWGDETSTTADFDEATDIIEGEIEGMLTALKGHRVTLAFSQGPNWRKAILPTYKANRKDKVLPLLLMELQEWAKVTYDSKFKPGLEGDDVLGIMATRRHNEERIIVSSDKDMQGVPGFLSRDGVTIVGISKAEADRFHMLQTLTGDPTDNYIGCRGVGIKKAERILDADGDEWWPLVVAAYEKYGFTEDHALIQARVARILRASDFDFKTGEPILWNPPKAKAA